jgi:hypothetical protein
LESNRFSDDEIATSLERHENLIRNPLLSKKYTYPKRLIFNIDAFYELANIDEYQFPSNLFSNRQVTVKKDFFRAFLNEIMDYYCISADKRNIEIAFVEERHVESNSGLMAIIKEDLFAFLFPYFLSPDNRESLFFSNISVIANAWSYYDHLWHSLPDECTYENVAKARLTDIIGRLMPKIQSPDLVT